VATLVAAFLVFSSEPNAHERRNRSVAQALRYRLHLLGHADRSLLMRVLLAFDCSISDVRHHRDMMTPLKINSVRNVAVRLLQFAEALWRGSLQVINFS
jgi:hypothetical protein